MAIEIAADNHIGSNGCKKLDRKRGYWELYEIYRFKEIGSTMTPDDDYFWACKHGDDIYYGSLLHDEDDFKNKPVWATHILFVPDGK